MTLVGYRVIIPQAPNYDHWHFCLDNLYWSVLRLVLNNSASWRDIKLKFWLCHENPGMGYRCAVLDIKDGQTFIADIRAADPRSYSTVGRGFSGRLLLIKSVGDVLTRGHQTWPRGLTGWRDHSSLIRKLRISADFWGQYTEAIYTITLLHYLQPPLAQVSCVPATQDPYLAKGNFTSNEFLCLNY